MTDISVQQQHEADETTIRRGLATFIAVGNALRRIRDSRSYRSVAGYSDFGSYCSEKWGFTRQRAHQLIESAEVAERVSTNVDTPADLPAIEAPLRDLRTARDALRRIRDEKLYRDQAASFEAYAAQRFGLEVDDLAELGLAA